MVKVHAGPDLALAVLHSQMVQDVGGVEAGVVAQLAGDDLEGFGEGLDDRLLLVVDFRVGVVVEVAGDFHLSGGAEVSEDVTKGGKGGDR